MAKTRRGWNLERCFTVGRNWILIGTPHISSGTLYKLEVHGTHHSRFRNTILLLPPPKKIAGSSAAAPRSSRRRWHCTSRSRQRRQRRTRRTRPRPSGSWTRCPRSPWTPTSSTPSRRRSSSSSQRRRPRSPSRPKSSPSTGEYRFGFSGAVLGPVSGSFFLFKKQYRKVDQKNTSFFSYTL